VFWRLTEEIRTEMVPNDVDVGASSKRAATALLISPATWRRAPDGLFLTCVAKDGRTFWERGDL